MKTLYVNINHKPISSSGELVILDYDLMGDLFFYLGERIAKGCNVQNENALITDFNTPDNKQDYDAILSQCDDIKRLLFGENVSGTFELKLPSGYLHWLRYNEDYNHVYDKNFSNGGGESITIDIEELYEDSIESLQRKIMRKLQRDDLYLDIDEIVFRDEDVTRKSKIVRAIKAKYDNIGFKSYKKFQRNHIDNSNQKGQVKWPAELECVNVDNITKHGYNPIAVIGHTDIDYLVLAKKNEKELVVKTSGEVLYSINYSHALSTLTGKYIVVKEYYNRVGLIRAINGEVLLPVSYSSSNELNEIEPGFFFNEKVGTYCAIIESHCLYTDPFLFIDQRHLRLYSKNTWKYIELREYLGECDDHLSFFVIEAKHMKNICLFSVIYNDLERKFIVSNDASKIYVLRNNEDIDGMDNSHIVLKQFGKISTILNSKLEHIFKEDYILDKDERVVSESDGMIVIMDRDRITRILDNNFHNILENSFINIHKPLTFKNGIALYQISKKRIGCIRRNGELLEIPWNYGNTIQSFEVFIGQFILVKKTSEERFLINISGESVVDIGRWDDIKVISETQFKVISCYDTTLYEISGNKVTKC